ncbi:hypothetical protein HMPREF0996_00816 [Lachnospiraceae bacterium 5_1_63FAA]|nr:hypothetical protein HMPREF0996_00816 [Lachnospiraceae bacterium 5_1_63FAA]
MIITKLDKVGTKQVRLFFDEEKYCLLYYNEIRRLGFHEQDEIGQEKFEELNKLLLHRAKLKAMSLLKYQDRTKKELKERLMRAEFPEFITEGAVAYVESFGYINDEEYVRRYMEYKSGSKSKIQIKMDLRKKGITAETLERVLRNMNTKKMISWKNRLRRGSVKRVLSLRRIFRNITDILREKDLIAAKY